MRVSDKALQAMEEAPSAAAARPRAPRQSRRWFWPWGKG